MYRFQTQREQIASDNVLLSQLKWPIETMYVGLRPTVNISASNPSQWRDWHRFVLLTDNVIDLSAKSNAQMVIDDTVAWNAGAGKTKTSASQETFGHITYPSVTSTIDTLQLQAHGINIFAQYGRKFFVDYMPFVFGGTNIITPGPASGAAMLNFALYPGTYQPSGHINVSRAREFYLQFTSSYVGANTPADLLVLAIAINFLLIFGTFWDETVSCPCSCYVTTSDKQCKHNHDSTAPMVELVYITY